MSPFLFWRPLVGSLRALTSAEMVALMCIAAARTGFLLAALQSVAERVNPPKARPPAPHGSHVLASAVGPCYRCWDEESRASEGLSQNQNPGVLRSIPLRGPCRDGSIKGERSCGSGRRRRAGRSSGKRGSVPPHLNPSPS